LTLPIKTTLQKENQTAINTEKTPNSKNCKSHHFKMKKTIHFQNSNYAIPESHTQTIASNKSQS
jgi:hypothetical protein